MLFDYTSNTVGASADTTITGHAQHIERSAQITEDDCAMT